MPKMMLAVGIPPWQVRGVRKHPQKAEQTGGVGVFVCVRVPVADLPCLCVPTAARGTLHPALPWDARSAPRAACRLRCVSLCSWEFSLGSPSLGIVWMNPEEPSREGGQGAGAPGARPRRGLLGRFRGCRSFGISPADSPWVFLPAEGVCQLRLRRLEEEVHALDEPQEIPRDGFLPAHRQGPGREDHAAGVHRWHPGFQ